MMIRGTLVRPLLFIFSAILLSGCLGKSTADEDYHPGIGVPRLTISATQSFSSTIVGNSSSATFTVTNTGTASATNLSISGLSSPFSYDSGTCGTSLATGASCTVTLLFTPVSGSTASATLTTNYYSGTATKTATASLSGTGVAYASGTLDTQTFNAPSGFNTLAVGTGSDYTQAIAIQSDGKIVVAGRTNSGAVMSLFVARYTKNGILDTTFDSDGYVTTLVGTASQAKGVAVQSDGKIVVVGDATVSSQTDMLVLRYTTSGALDTDFNSVGYVRADIGYSPNENDYANAVAIASSGRIIVGGSRINYGIAENDEAAFICIESNGTPCTDFGPMTNAWYTGSFWADGVSDAQINAMVIQSDGKIVGACGYDGGAGVDYIQLVRLNSDGSADTSFDGTSNGNGVISQLPFEATTSYGMVRGLGVKSNGHYIVGGYYLNGVVANYDFFFNDFDTNGIDQGGATTDFSGGSAEQCASLAIDANDNIVMMGQSSASELILARYSGSPGSYALDTSFGSGGYITSSVSRGSLGAMAIQTDGKIVVGAHKAVSTFDVAVSRFWP